MVPAFIIVGLFMPVPIEPSTIHFERSAEIHASPEKILPPIADLRMWMAWSPWEKRDPNLQRGYYRA